MVLASAKGSVPRMSEVFAGEPIRGSWWGHNKGHEINAALGFVSDSPYALVCRLKEGKNTFVHRRLWPALIRVAHHFAPERLANVEQEHTKSGHHVNHETPFPSGRTPTGSGRLRSLRNRKPSTPSAGGPSRDE